MTYYAVQPRDVASGQASGKISRQQIDELIDEGANVYVYTARDAASGQATGKRSHQPRDAASGQATGKRSYQPRDVASGQSSGKRNYQPRDAATGQASGKRTHHPLLWSNDPYVEDAQSRTIDPYSEDAVFFIGGSAGKDVNFVIPLNLYAENISLPSNTNTPVQSVKATKSRSNIQNNRTATKTRSNIQNNRVGNSSPGTPEQPKSSINTSRSNIKNQRLADSGDLANAGNIEVISMSRIRCADGAGKINAIVYIEGIPYDAVISGVLKTKHDTAKNSIGNIR